MSENQSQPNSAGARAPGGEPQLRPQPDGPLNDHPSDVEAAHNPEEGSAVRDPRLQTDAARQASVDANHGSLDGHAPRDPRPDYGSGQGTSGTDRKTAGAELADRLPKAAVRTETDEQGRRIEP